MQPASCLIRHPVPFIYHCAWEAGRLFALLSVSSVILLLLQTGKMLSLPTPPFCLCPFGISAERWKQNHPSWLRKRFILTRVRPVETQRSHWGWREEYLGGEKPSVSLARAWLTFSGALGGLFTERTHIVLFASASTLPLECVCDPVRCSITRQHITLLCR